MKSKHLLLLGAALCCLFTAVNLASAQNTVVTYQGLVQSGGKGFTGTGHFKFALVTSSNISAQATATANNSGGFVTIYTVTFGGSGYVSAPSVTVSGGGGSGATATAVISGGVVTSITANNPGAGYTGTPTVTIAAPPEILSYTTYWSNDGTSVAGSEPAAGVNVAVSNGLFTARLGDTTLPNMTVLGGGLFTQPNLQLRLWFSDDVNGFSVLHPAQPLTAAPYAFVAGSASNLLGPVSAGQLSGTYDNAVAFNNSANQFAGSYVGNGAGVSNVNAAMLGGLSLGGFWQTAGNAGTTTGTHFLGTTDNVPLELKAKGTRALRLEPTTDSASRNRVNVIGGSVANFASSGVAGATIAGGGGIPVGGAGNTQTTNVVTDDFGTVGGGLGNQAGNNTGSLSDASTATVAGGSGNTAGGSGAAVGGGSGNTASGLQATVPGGVQNTAGGSFSFAAGHRAKANHSGALVWADSSSGTDFSSTANNQFLIRATGGVGIGTTNPVGQLDVYSAGQCYTRLFSADSSNGSVLELRNDSASSPTYIGAINFQTPSSTPGQIGYGDGNGLTLRSGSSERMRITPAGLVGIGRTPTLNVLEVEGNASKTTAGSWLANSDARIKQDIQVITGALDKLAQVRLVKFRYTDDYRAAHPGLADHEYLNVIAQEFQRVFPDAVKSSRETLPDGAGEILQVDTYPLTIYSAAAVQELNRKLEQKQTEITELKRRMEEMERLFTALAGNGGVR